MRWGLWLALAGLNGGISVAAGAFAAHGLQAMGDAYAVELMEKVARYQLVGAVGLLVVAWLRERGLSGRAADVAGWLFLSGIVLFCGALSGIALAGLPMGMVAPFGGTALILGWFTLAAIGLRTGRKSP